MGWVPSSKISGTEGGGRSIFSKGNSEWERGGLLPRKDVGAGQAKPTASPHTFIQSPACKAGPLEGVSLILLTMPVLSLILFVAAGCLAVHTAQFAEPRGDKARAERLEGSSGSCRNCRRLFSPGWARQRSSRHNISSHNTTQPQGVPGGACICLQSTSGRGPASTS